MPTRRTLLETGAFVVLLKSMLGSAWASGSPVELDAWARELAGLNEALRDGAIGVTEWQERIETLNGSVDLTSLVRYLDIDALTRRFTYETRLADTADPALPAEIASRRRQWFVRVFGMRRGGAVIPHVHNNMVSAHLVISGDFHARTADRVRDVDGAVVLRPTRSGPIGVGEVISMSDLRDNHHWLLAREDRSMTLDVGVVSLPDVRQYAHEANRYSMIFVDADQRPERDGTIVAPLMSFEACATKYAS
ncbi:MAG: hypothetical protein R3C16_11950 [Hyphomonadaceae bacterium]